MPRTSRSTFTPARDASYSSRIICGSTRAFILKMRRPCRPRRWWSNLAQNQGLETLPHRDRRDEEFLEIALCRVPRQVIEKIGRIG